MAVKNKVQLITYPDSLGGNLKELYQILHKYFLGVFVGGIHILPPFPSSGDRGFAPIDYLQIAPRFGTWEDMRRIGMDFDLMVDLMVNHISGESEYFQDFLKKGRKSEYTDLFITLDKIWQEGIPVKDDIDKMFLRRARPYSVFHIDATNKTERLWTTFGKTDPSEQIDLDVNSVGTKRLFQRYFEHFSANYIKMVRLDAVGYVVKKPGTSCFFVEPEIYDFLDYIIGLANSMDIELLPEVHSHYSIQWKLAEHGLWIYDFILPYMVLDSLINKSSKRLCHYLANRPAKQFTMLDCHDGIPVKPDMDGLADAEEAQKLVDICLKRGANLSLIVSDQHKSENGFDVHQIRGTYYSLLNCDDDAYLAARAIQLFVPGVPQIYYVGLLAGKNDMKAVDMHHEGREINRHNYSVQEIEEALQTEAVVRLLRLIRFRNENEVFDGTFTVHDAPDGEIHLSWTKESRFAKLHIDLDTNQTKITYNNHIGEEIRYIV